MPALYEKIKEKYLQSGKSDKESKKLAAMTYNSKRKKDKSMPKLSPQHKSKK